MHVRIYLILHTSIAFGCKYVCKCHETYRNASKRNKEAR